MYTFSLLLFFSRKSICIHEQQTKGVKLTLTICYAINSTVPEMQQMMMCLYVYLSRHQPNHTGKLNLMNKHSRK